MALERDPRLTGHQPGLDGVRGLAILGVMGLHFVGEFAPTNRLEDLLSRLSSFGTLGVDLFFVLSGFLITGLLLEAKGRPAYFRNFYARRTLRIFPLYYAVLAVVFLVLPHFITLHPGLEQARAEQGWLWTYTSNFFIARHGDWALGYLSHFWSLAIEEHFYLVWPLVVFLVSRRALERICAAVIVAGLGLRLALAWAGWHPLSIWVLTPARVDTLCVGALLAALVRREEGLEPWMRRAPWALLLVGAAIQLQWAWRVKVGSGLAYVQEVRTTLWALFFGAVTVTSLSDGAPQRWLFRNRVLRTFGKYAYGLYVFHGILGPWIRDSDALGRLSVLLGGRHTLALFVKIGLASTVSLAVAWASYELFEKHFLRLKGRFEPAPAVAVAPAPAPGARDAR